jgi:hypothetical protein
MVVMPVELILHSTDKKGAADVLRRFTIYPGAVDRIVERGGGTLDLGLDLRSMEKIRAYWDIVE